MENLTIRKQSQLAPKYVLQMEGLNLFVAEKQDLTGCNLTPNIKKAMEFSVGFDNEAIKTSIWAATAKLMMNTNVAFNAFYL